MRRCPECGREEQNREIRFCPSDGAALTEQPAAGAPVAVPLDEPDPEHDPNLGRVLGGRFILRSRLGGGGFGTVYLADYPRSAVERYKQVAVKLFHPRLAVEKDAVRRFALEANVLAELRAPNIVDIVACEWEADGSLFLAMEYLQGITLRDLLRRQRRLSLAWSVAILDPICRGIEAAHAQGVLHRDLKPENLILLGPGAFAWPGALTVKLLDFGIARVRQGKLLGSDSPTTQAGMILGTPEYASPEQALGEELDERSDIYALGILLFEMLTGRVPFRRERTDSPLPVLMAHVHTPAPMLRNVQPDADGGVAAEALVQRLLAKDRRERPGTAREVRERLHALLEEVRTALPDPLDDEEPPTAVGIPQPATVAASTSSAPADTGLVSLGVAPTSLPFPRIEPEPTRRWRPGWLFFLLFLGLAGGGALVWLGGHGESLQPATQALGSSNTPTSLQRKAATDRGPTAAAGEVDAMAASAMAREGQDAGRGGERVEGVPAMADVGGSDPAERAATRDAGQRPATSISPSQRPAVRALPSRILLDSRPSGAEVLDARDRRVAGCARTPCSIPNPHVATQYKLRLAGYFPGRVTVSPGRIKPVVVTLRPNEVKLEESP